jgi:predicted RNase H-like HicB family nuclease
VSKYVFIIERGDDGGYGASCPDLPGCVAVGDTYDETVTLMREAVAMHLDGMREDGDPIPTPTVVGASSVDTA